MCKRLIEEIKMLEKEKEKLEKSLKNANIFDAKNSNDLVIYNDVYEEYKEVEHDINCKIKELSYISIGFKSEQEWIDYVGEADCMSSEQDEYEDGDEDTKRLEKLYNSSYIDRLINYNHKHIDYGLGDLFIEIYEIYMDHKLEYLTDNVQNLLCKLEKTLEKNINIYEDQITYKGIDTMEYAKYKLNEVLSEDIETVKEAIIDIAEYMYKPNNRKKRRYRSSKFKIKSSDYFNLLYEGKTIEEIAIIKNLKVASVKRFFKRKEKEYLKKDNLADKWGINEDVFSYFIYWTNNGKNRKN